MSHSSQRSPKSARSIGHILKNAEKEEDKPHNVGTQVDITKSSNEKTPIAASLSVPRVIKHTIGETKQENIANSTKESVSSEIEGENVGFVEIKEDNGQSELCRNGLELLELPTGIVFDEIFIKLHIPPQSMWHCEGPLRVQYINDIITDYLGYREKKTPIRYRSHGQSDELCILFDRKSKRPSLPRGRSVVRIPFELVLEEDLKRVHDIDHLERVKFFENSSVDEHPVDSYFTSNSLEAAQLSAGATVEAARCIMRGKILNGMVIARPPGHHAERSMVKKEGWGFCFYNNIAVAAARLVEEFKVKVLILDWDIHHCNGTENIFWESRDVLVISMHRYGCFYPGTGPCSAIGGETARGYNVNMAWDFESCRAMRNYDYIEAFNRIVIPVSQSFLPDIVLVSAGFDAARGDPIGRMDLTRELRRDVGGLTSQGFAAMTKLVTELPGCKGRVLLVLEGGYNTEGPFSASQCALACLKVLRGETAPEIIGSASDAAKRVISETEAFHHEFWPIFMTCSAENVNPKIESKNEDLERALESLQLEDDFGDYGNFGGFAMHDV